MLNLGQEHFKSRVVAVFFFLLVSNAESNSLIENKNVFENKSIGIINTLYRGGNSLWLGGEKGIYRIRGNSIEKPEVWGLDFEVMDILEDHKKNVWIASIGGGVHKIEYGNGHIHKIEGLEESKNCWGLSLDKEKNLVAACEQNLFRISNENLFVTSLLKGKISQNTSGITEIAVDGKSNVWFITLDYGIFYYHQATGEIKEFLSTTFKRKENEITDLFSDRLGNIWLATREGALRVESESLKVSNFPFANPTDNSFIASIYQDKYGEMWFAGNTLYKLDFSSENLVISSSLFPTWPNWRKGFINDIAGGDSGELFLAANLYGLVELPATGDLVTFLVDEGGKPVKNIAFSFEYSGQIIFSDGSNLYSYDVSKKSSTKLIQGLGYVYTSVMLDEHRVLLSVENKGLIIVNLVDYQLVHVMPGRYGLPETAFSEIFALETGTDGTIYIGYFGDKLKGIYAGTFEEGFSELNKDVYVDEMLRSEEGDIFVSTRKKGVLQLKHKKQTRFWEVEDFEHELITNCLVEGLDGVIWICTNGEGLAYLDGSSGKIQFIGKEHTNGSLLIRDLVSDNQGYLWLMTGDGLMRFDPRTYDSISLGKEDAVYDIDFEITASLKLSSNNIMVAGDHYNYIIDSEKLNAYLDTRSQLTTNVVMTNLEVLNKQESSKISGTSRLNKAILEKIPLELAYNEYLFTFRFAANNYIERNTLGFEYRLLGLSDNWNKSEPDEASATYSTLPHGSYEFQVRVIDPKSRVEQPISSVSITVFPPYWLTWQAFLIYWSLFWACIYLAYKYRIRSLKKRNMLLASEVKERTEQLETSHKIVGKLLNQKEQFFENLSHEFKTPITLILGPVEKLKCESNSPETSSAIEVIERNTQRLEYLVEEVLDLSKSNYVCKTDKKTYFVSESLAILVQAFRPLASSKNQRITLENYSKIKLNLYADSFERIVTNLLSNAIKYSPKGGDIIIRSFDWQDSYLLQIKDNGAGITENQKSSVFERFTRLDDTNNEIGTGLGLAVTKDIVEANNGTINIESINGKGATFTVTFHSDSQVLIENEAVSEDQCIELTVFEENAGQQHEETEKKKLLIVEDNKDMANYILDCLSRDFTCQLAEDGSVGIVKATQQVPDMIITDLMMPQKSGFELVDVVRENEITSHIPIIVLTAKSDIESRMSGWHKNVDDYVSKPFAAEELVARIKRLFTIRDLVRNNLACEVLTTPEPEKQIEKYSFKSAKDKVFFERFVETIKSGFSDESFNRSKAAAKMAMSERQLNRKLSGLIDRNFSEFLKRYRLEKAKELLLCGHQITTVSYDVGFSSPSYFSSCFKAEFGLTPKAFVESEVGA